MTNPITRAEFIAKTARQAKAAIARQIAKETGEELGNYVEYTAVELATRLADLQGWADASDHEGPHELDVSSDVPPADFDPITDPPVTEAELLATKEKVVANLLAQLAAEKTQSGRKKIRAQLRTAGYRLSEHKAKVEKAAKEKKEPKVKAAKKSKKSKVDSDGNRK